MGVARIGKTRARPSFFENGGDAFPRFEVPEVEGVGAGILGHKVVGLILVAIIAVGYVVGWMRTSWFAS